MGASLHRCAARTKGSARWQAVVLLVLLLVRAGGEISGEQEEMRILHPAPDVVVSAVSPLEMRCSFAGLRGAEDFSVTIDLDEFDGGEFPIAADGEYSFETRDMMLDTVVYVRASCGYASTELVCDDDAGAGNASLAQARLTAGQTVYVFVDGFSARADGAYTLTVSAL